MQPNIPTFFFSTVSQLKRGDTSVTCLLFWLLISLVLQSCDRQQSNNDQVTADQNTSTQNSMMLNTINRDSPNVASPDWGNAATLTAMGYPPIATGDIRVWDQWVNDPKLPPSVIDLGIRYQPNAELVAQLPVDMVIDNYFYEHARNLYGEVPTESVLFFSEDKYSTWAVYVKPTQELGRLIEQPEAAEAYIATSRRKIEQAGQRLRARYPNVNKFAVVQFVDANNMRMYSTNSLFNAVLTMMGYDLIALADGNQWGFTPIQLGDLARLDDDVCLLVIEPLTPITEAQLQRSLIWQRLGYANVLSQSTTHNDSSDIPSRCMAKLDPIWIYGGMSSLVTLAENMASDTLAGGVAE